jgi:hypothetical protein
VSRKIAYGIILLLTFTVCCIVLTAEPASAWSNGGYSTDPSHPAYGTHDWIAQHALDNLPTVEKQYLLNNLNVYLCGTELPDNGQAPDGIGDTGKHHFYFYANGTVQDDASATRAAQMYQTALTYLKAKDYSDAAKAAGTMSHYVVDIGVWAHVMGASTDWGSETGNNHANYEEYVNRRTSSYKDEFNKYLSYDGALSVISAYDATEELANDTTFDNGQAYNCTWMNQNYGTANPAYWDRAGESLNLAVNYLTDILHTLYLDANPSATPTPSPSPTVSPTPSVPEFPPAIMIPLLIASIFTIVALKQKRKGRDGCCVNLMIAIN